MVKISPTGPLWLEDVLKVFNRLRSFKRSTMNICPLKAIHLGPFKTHPSIKYLLNSIWADLKMIPYPWKIHKKTYPL